MSSLSLSTSLLESTSELEDDFFFSASLVDEALESLVEDDLLEELELEELVDFAVDEAEDVAGLDALVVEGFDVDGLEAGLGDEGGLLAPELPLFLILTKHHLPSTCHSHVRANYPNWQVPPLKDLARDADNLG